MLEPAGFASLLPGEVLVCPYTNPSWTPLFERAVAVVVDTGGLASHAAIVAREYGIPAVMGTGTGTRVLRDGDPSRSMATPESCERARPGDDDGSRRWAMPWPLMPPGRAVVPRACEVKVLPVRRLPGSRAGRG